MQSHNFGKIPAVVKNYFFEKSIRYRFANIEQLNDISNAGYLKIIKCSKSPWSIWEFNKFLRNNLNLKEQNRGIGITIMIERRSNKKTIRVYSKKFIIIKFKLNGCRKKIILVKSVELTQ